MSLQPETPFFFIEYREFNVPPLTPPHPGDDEKTAFNTAWTPTVSTAYYAYDPQWAQLADIEFAHDLPPLTSIRQREQLVDYEINEMVILLRGGVFTAVQFTQAYLQRIERLNGSPHTYDENGGYNAFVRIDAEAALEQARQADAWLRNPDDPRGVAPRLYGIPFGISDVIAIKDQECTNGSALFTGNLAHEDATVVARLRAQGAVLIGHTTCSQLSADVLGQFSANAWDPSRIPGGSNQGSAVAPMARLAAATLATETAGSLIIPAAANGASAIKPSPGLVSTFGVMPLRTGWDVVGPIARSVRDASLILSAIAGVDQMNDPQTLSAPIPFPPLPITPRISPQPLLGVTISIPQTDWMTGHLHIPPFEAYGADHRAAFITFRRELTELGATVIEFPWLDLSIEDNAPYSFGTPLHEIENEAGEVQYITAPLATTYANQLENRYWEAVRDFANTLKDEVQREALLEAYRPDANDALAGAISFSIRLLAEERRRQQQTLFDKALEQYKIDFMVVLPIGAHIGLRFDEDHRRLMPVRRAFVDLPNALTWPMVTFPIGHGRTGLPLSLPINAAFWGPRFSEALLVQAAMDFQYHYPEYHNTVPPEPEFGPVTQRPPDFPRVRNLPPEYSTDPLILEKERRVRLSATESHGKGIIWGQSAALRKAWNTFWSR